jgi:predicted nucleic acid-binding protein
MTHPVIFAFVRIGTNSRAFGEPMSLDEASGHVISWLDRQVTRVLVPATDHVPQVLNLLVAAGSAGANLVTDAQVAAMAIAYGATVHTADRDFMRFPGLRSSYPLA